ncbi:MAG: hypothetical protein ABMB14_30245, partial [Myxococcota bacterium]
MTLALVPVLLAACAAPTSSPTGSRPPDGALDPTGSEPSASATTPSPTTAPTSTGTTAPSVSLSVTELDVGTAHLGYLRRTATVTVDNPTAAAVALEATVDGDPRLSVDPPPAELAAGASVDVTVAVDPTAEGPIDGTLRLAGRSVPVVGEVGPPLPMTLVGPYGRFLTSLDYGSTFALDVQEEADDGDGHSENLLRGCTGADGVLIAVGGDHQGTYRRSVDGLTWDAPFVGTRGWVADVAYGGGRFVSVGGFGNLAWSTDGIGWTETYNDYG